MQSLRRVLALMVAVLSMSGVLVGAGVWTASPAAAAASSNGDFSPLWEAPVLADTTVPANGRITVQVLGNGGIPATGVSAASLKYTVKNVSAFGWLDVYPTDQAAPNLSTVSFYPGESTTNADLTRITSTGMIYIANHSDQPITVSVTTNGYFLNGVATGVITSRNGDRCVDVAGGLNANGTAIQLYDCNNGNAQKITLPGDGTLRVLGKCLDLTDGATANGTKVRLWDCNGSAAQQWVPHPDGTVVNPGSGRCFDAAANGTVNGTLIQIWDCNGGPGQYWNVPQPAGKTGYQPLPTTALYDTRNGTGSPSRTTPIPANSSLTIDVHGHNGIPATTADAGAVAFNVLATQHTANGALGLHPSDAPASSPIVAFNTGESNGVFTIAQMSDTGKLTIENNSNGTVHVLISVRGYFAWTDAASEDKFMPIAPKMVLDTTTGQGRIIDEDGYSIVDTTPIGANESALVDVGSALPDMENQNFSAVAVTINARQPTSYGWLSVYATDSADPNLSSVNYSPNESVVGFDIAAPNEFGQLTITNHSTGTVHLQVSVRGYYMIPADVSVADDPNEQEVELNNDYLNYNPIPTSWTPTGRFQARPACESEGHWKFTIWGKQKKFKSIFSSDVYDNRQGSTSLKIQEQSTTTGSLSATWSWGGEGTIPKARIKHLLQRTAGITVQGSVSWSKTRTMEFTVPAGKITSFKYGFFRYRVWGQEAYVDRCGKELTNTRNSIVVNAPGQKGWKRYES